MSVFPSSLLFPIKHCRLTRKEASFSQGAHISSHLCCAEGGSAAQAIATASAHALAAGGSEGVAIARAFAVAIGIYSCPGVKPVLARECPSRPFRLSLSRDQQSKQDGECKILLTC